MPASPSTQNLTIFKAIIAIKLAGEASFRDVGEVPEAEWTPEIENLDYFSNRTGVRSKTKTVVIEKGGTLRLVFNEVTPENMQLKLLGDIGVNSDGETEIDIFSQNSISGAQVQITGTNEVGTKIRVLFNNVAFNPSGSLPFISEEWAAIEIEAETLADANGKFGTVTFIGEEATA